MEDNNKKSDIYQIAALAALLLSLVLLLSPPPTVSHFVKVDDYINNSETIELNKVEYIGRERVNIGASQSKHVYKIKANNVYYALEFYPDGTRDYSSIRLSRGKLYDQVFIKLNPIELDKHKGTIEDPIPTYNYGFTANEFIWSAQKYQYNIKTHRVLEEILHVKSYQWILWLIMAICAPPLFVLSLKSKSEEMAREKAAKKAKR